MKAQFRCSECGSPTAKLLVVSDIGQVVEMLRSHARLEDDTELPLLPADARALLLKLGKK